jgi:molybdopterin/thiamine biosynthesis adenylyltransferase
MNDAQKKRYARQLVLDGIGADGQEKLLQSKVLVVGAGGLGSAVIPYLAGAGISDIGIIDNDTVSITNLHRQVLHASKATGMNKAKSAKLAILLLNPNIRVTTYPSLLTEENAESIFSGYDFVVDACDNFPTKYLINDTCVRLGIPFVHAGVLQYSGQVLTCIPGQSACLRCVLPDDPGILKDTCKTKGVLGPVVGTLGCIEATEVIKYLTGIGDLLTDRVLIFDGLHMTFDTLPVSRQAACPVCSNH